MALRTTSIIHAYPLDSASPVEFDDSTGLPIYDRSYNAADLRRVMALMMTDGVFPDDGEELLVSRSDAGTWSVGTGTFVANGLVTRVASTAAVIDQSDIASGSYAFIIAAGRFDSGTRDGAIYPVVVETPSYAPVRTESVWELVLARIDWTGAMRDYRLDPVMCGAVAPVLPVDTESFMAELRTAVSQFNLNVGTVESLPSGTTPRVTVRKPEVAGGDVYIDFGIPRGAPGKDGEDGTAPPTVYVRPSGQEPPHDFGTVWFVEDRSTVPHVVTDLRVFESNGLYPDEDVYPADETWPGGEGGWESHRLSSSIVMGGGGGGTGSGGITVGEGDPGTLTEPGTYIDSLTGNLWQWSEA